MGMFDTFMLKIPIKCTCGKEHIDFQSKSLDYYMDTYHQGEKAQSYYLRKLTSEEEAVKKENMDKESPGMYGTPLGNLCGCLTISDEVRSVVLDGIYNCYTNCSFCNSWIEADALINNGIFVNIKINSIEKNP